MFKRIIVFLSTIIGFSFGATFGILIWTNVNLNVQYLNNPYVNALIFGLLFAILGIFLAPIIEKTIKALIDVLNRQSIPNLLLSLVGIVTGLVIGYLIGLPFTTFNIPFLSTTLPFALSIILALVGYHTVNSRKDEWANFLGQIGKGSNKIDESKPEAIGNEKLASSTSNYKILDTSVIIDGRIADIVQTNFIEGTLVIPNFVLNELQHIADSSDSLKRSKGRRGLDILNQLQKDNAIPIEFYEGDFEDIDEVDSKLVRLAKLVDGTIMTNDYNLNKVAEFQSIPVLNINELANAVKPVLIPGEELEVVVLKAGTERKQGVAYLEDGTMIVVEDGQYHMNENLNVVVTSAIQTNAGRMIFAKPITSNDQR